MDQTVDAGGVERIAADQQGLYRKRTAQLRTAQEAGHHLPYRLVRAQAEQAWNLTEHGPQPVERLGGQLGEADIEDALGMAQQGQVTLDIPGLDAADFSQRLFKRTTVIEPAAVTECEAVPGRQRHQPDMIGELLVEQHEQFFEKERCGDDRRAGVMPETLAFEHTGAAADVIATIDQSDFITFGTQAQRRGNATEPGTDDDGVHQQASRTDTASSSLARIPAQ